MTENYFKPLIYRLKNHLESKTTDKGSKTFRVEVKKYFDPDIYAQEMDLLQSLPIALGPLQSLTKPGDYFTNEFLNHAMIATRSSVDTIRVFANTCKHRSATLLTDAFGNTPTITCPYHGWQYNLCGQLIQCGSAHAMSEANLEKIRLTEYQCREAAGLLWALPKELSLGWPDYIAPLTQDFQHLWQENYQPIAQFTLLGEFNWKIAVESFLEIYHFSHLHQRTIPDLLYPDVALMDELGMHARITVPMNSFVTQLKDQAENEWQLLPHTNILYFIFPCNLLLIMRGFYAWITLKPLAVNRTQIQLTMMVPTPGDAELIQRAKLSTEGLKMILSEDIVICNGLQQNIQKNGITHFNYTLLEQLIVHFHLQLETAKTPLWKTSHALQNCTA